MMVKGEKGRGHLGKKPVILTLIMLTRLHFLFSSLQSPKIQEDDCSTLRWDGARSWEVIRRSKAGERNAAYLATEMKNHV